MSDPLATPYAIFQNQQQTITKNPHGKHFGDALILPKPPDITRCEFRNVDGIHLDRKGYEFRDTFEQEQSIGADLFGITETKANQEHYLVKQAYHQTGRQTCGMHHTGILGGSTLAYDSKVRYGGTLTMTVNDTRGRVVNKISNPWGR
jgi:hypothetical protein